MDTRGDAALLGYQGLEGENAMDWLLSGSDEAEGAGGAPPGLVSELRPEDVPKVDDALRHARGGSGSDLALHLAAAQSGTPVLREQLAPAHMSVRRDSLPGIDTSGERVTLDHVPLALQHHPAHPAQTAQLQLAQQQAFVAQGVAGAPAVAAAHLHAQPSLGGYLLAGSSAASSSNGTHAMAISSLPATPHSASESTELSQERSPSMGLAGPQRALSARSAPAVQGASPSVARHTLAVPGVVTRARVQRGFSAAGGGGATGISGGGGGGGGGGGSAAAMGPSASAHEARRPAPLVNMLGASGALLTAPSAPATAPLSLNVDVSSPSMARPRPLSSGSATSKKNKDRMQHQAEECRRRTRLRERFNQLREAAECEKKDRFNILTVAIERIESNRERLRLTEAARDEAFRHLEALRAAVAAKAGPAALLPAPLHGLHGPAAQIAPNGAFLDCNLAFCGLLRVTRESVLAQSIVSIVPREEVRRMASALMRARAETSGAWNMHCSLIAHSGQPVPVSLAASREANGWLLLFSPIVDMAAGAETVTDEQLAQLKEGRI